MESTATEKKTVILTVPPVEGYTLELLPGEFTGTWADAMAWAKAQGGDLPTRTEQTLLHQNAGGEFKRDWYWSNEKHASNGGYAWYQDFNDGNQYYSHQDDELRARAVRRASIR